MNAYFAILLIRILHSVKIEHQSVLYFCAFVDIRLQVVKSSKLPQQRGSYLLRRSRCSYDDIISDAVTSSFPATEMLSIETISGKLRSVFSC